MGWFVHEEDDGGGGGGGGLILFGRRIPSIKTSRITFSGVFSLTSLDLNFLDAVSESLCLLL